MRTSSVLSRAPNGRSEGTYLPRDNKYAHRRTEPADRHAAAKSPGLRGFSSAPERTRTSTGHTAHKALNLARLPIPPQAPEAASIAPGQRFQGFWIGGIGALGREVA